MPAGTPKVTMFGGKTIAPGGSQTFNSSGTWTAPAGITRVSFNARGGSGNPGNAGNPGKTTGGGGAGGDGGSVIVEGWTGVCPCCPGGTYNYITGQGGGQRGFRKLQPCCGPANGSPGTAGNSGGTTSVFGYNYAGGSSGNGGTGGNATGSPFGDAGYGQNGNQYVGPGPFNGNYPGSGGGGTTIGVGGSGASGGNGAPGTNTYGGGGGGGGAKFYGGGNPGSGISGGSGQAGSGPGGPGGSAGCCYTRSGKCGTPSNYDLGGAGGGGGGFVPSGFSNQFGVPIGNVGAGGGGGGGGTCVVYYGNPGNPGNSGNLGTSGGQSCVTVTSGASYPVTVPSGGFVNISWNPQ